MKSQTSNIQHPTSKKIAIVCDWLIGGGAEKVVLELHKMFPKAPIYTSYCSVEWQSKLNNKVITGYLQRWPYARLRKFIPFLRARWFKRLDFSGYDLVISCSGAEAKAVRSGAFAKHIAYIHAPTHYYWDRYNEYLENPGFGMFNWLARFGLRTLGGPMRRWDYEAAQRSDILIANSNYTKKQIKKYYKRSSTVIHPPVEPKTNPPAGGQKPKTKRSGFVVVGRQVPYKRIDLAVSACKKLNLPLTVIGNGPEHKKLIRMSGTQTKFLTAASDKKIAETVAKAEAFIFPGLDDFGIAAVEALAVGTPVIAYKDGGALDYIKPAKNGEFFTEQSEESLVHALKNFNSDKYSPRDIQSSAKAFSSQNFRKKILDIIEKTV